jgi:hypothetical protein
MATINYRNASCIYESADTLAVESLSLDIEDGECWPVSRTSTRVPSRSTART